MPDVGIMNAVLSEQSRRSEMLSDSGGGLLANSLAIEGSGVSDSPVSIMVYG